MKTIKVKKIEMIDRKKGRKIVVTLSNGRRITIEACHESWQQYGGTTEELYITMPIAEKYNDWLHNSNLY